MMPNFFVVGAARSGTTSLYRYLKQHPEIYMARKEVHFFAAEHFPYSGPGDEWLNRRSIRDEEQYAQLFSSVAGEKAIGETSAFYLCLPGTAERIAQALPDAKIIMLLREPVDRAYSSYMYLARDGRETLSFTEGLGREEERKQRGFEPIWWYKELSLYTSQVKRYLEVFGKERVKVLLYDEFYAHPGRVLCDVFAFLGVREDVAIDTSVRYNVSGLPKSRRLYSFLYNLMEKPGALAKRIKPLVPLQLREAVMQKAMHTFIRQVPIDPQVQLQFKAGFAEDVGKLEELLQLDLRCWQYREPSLAQKK